MSGALNTLSAIVAGLKIPHLIVEEDCWYSCPKAPSEFGEGSACCDDEKVQRGDCTCGADAHNAKVDEVLAFLKGLGLR